MQPAGTGCMFSPIERYDKVLMTLRLPCICSVILCIAPLAASAANFPVRLLVEIKDEEGGAIEDALVTVQFWYWNEDTGYRVFSDVQQFSNASGRSLFDEQTYGQIMVTAKHPEHYASTWSLSFHNPRLRLPLLMRSIRNPARMAFYQAVVRPFPAIEGTFEFDLLDLDWLPPHGEGRRADVALTVVSRYRSDEQYQAVVRMHFQEQDAGIREIELEANERRSAFRAHHVAPADGYVPDLFFEDTYGLRNMEEAVSGDGFYFRIRTQRNAEGAMEGYYGRFHGPVIQMTPAGPLLVLGPLLINPRFNDRNMESEQKATRSKEEWQAAREGL